MDSSTETKIEKYEIRQLMRRQVDEKVEQGRFQAALISDLSILLSAMATVQTDPSPKIKSMGGNIASSSSARITTKGCIP